MKIKFRHFNLIIIYIIVLKFRVGGEVVVTPRVDGLVDGMSLGGGGPPPTPRLYCIESPPPFPFFKRVIGWLLVGVVFNPPNFFIFLSRLMGSGYLPPPPSPQHYRMVVGMQLGGWSVDNIKLWQIKNKNLRALFSLRNSLTGFKCVE